MRQTPYFDKIIEAKWWPGDIVHTVDGKLNGIGQFDHGRYFAAGYPLRIVSSYPTFALSDSGHRPVLLNEYYKDNFELQNKEIDESRQFMSLVEDEFNDILSNLELKVKEPYASLGLIATPVKLGDYFTRNLHNRFLFCEAFPEHDNNRIDVASVNMLIEHPLRLKHRLPIRTIHGKLVRLNYPRTFLLISPQREGSRSSQNGLDNIALLMREGSIYAQYVNYKEACVIAALEYD